MSDLSQMEVKQLRNEVQLLRDELAIFKRKYEDIIYNLDDDNFSSTLLREKEGMKTSIEVNAEGIKTKVSNEEFESAITQTAGLIESKVSDLNDALSTRITQTEELIETEVQSLTNVDAWLSSSITQTSNEIKSSVSSVFNTITKVNSTSDMTDKSKLYTYNGVNYYYNNVQGKWMQVSGNSIASSFVQTSSGFQLKGDVSISGDAIVGGTISGASLQNSEGTHYLQMSESSGGVGEYGTFRLYNDKYSSVPYFSIYDNELGHIGLSAAGVPFLGVTVSGGTPTVETYGNWDIGGGTAKFA